MQEIKQLIAFLECDINEAENRGYLPANLAILKLVIALHERMDKLEEALLPKEESEVWKGLDTLISGSQKIIDLHEETALPPMNVQRTIHFPRKQWDEEPRLYGSHIQENNAPRVFKSALKDIVTKEILEYSEHKSFSGHLENGIASCYLEAQRYAYSKAMKAVGIASDGTSEGIINTVKGFVGKLKTTVSDALTWAKEQVASIVSTMQELFDNFISGLGDIDPAEIAIQVQEFLTNLAGWKSEQIVNVAWQSGLDIGTNAAIMDILDAATNPDMLPGLAIDNMRVRVLPEESSSDRCREFAGQDYGLEEYTALGINFPFHPNCPHYADVYMDIGDEM